MTDDRPRRAAPAWLAALGRVVARIITIVMVVLRPPEQMNGHAFPPDVPRPRPDEYRP